MANKDFTQTLPEPTETELDDIVIHVAGGVARQVVIVYRLVDLNGNTLSCGQKTISKDFGSLPAPKQTLIATLVNDALTFIRNKFSLATTIDEA